MSWLGTMRTLRIRSILPCLFFLLVLGDTVPAFAKADLEKEMASKILNLFPSYSGHVSNIENAVILIQGSPNESLQEGSLLLIQARGSKRTAPAKERMLQVISVKDGEVRAEPVGAAAAKPGDPITGWPRPLPVALVPMSREALRVLLGTPLPKGDLRIVRTEDVLTAMIENHYDDFSALENANLEHLSTSLKTDLILQVSILKGFGQEVLQIKPHWMKQDQALQAFSILLSSEIRSVAAPETMITTDAPMALAPAETQVPPVVRPSDVIPMVKEMEETRPSVALEMNSHGRPSPKPLPPLPSLADFDHPARWERIFEGKERIIAMVPGSFTGPGKQELAIGVPGKIQIYSFRKGRLRAGERLENPYLTTLFSLDAWDVNGDGIDEIIVDTDEGTALLAQQNGRPYRAHQQEGLAIRKIGSQLFAQELSTIGMEEASIYRVQWDGTTWVIGEKLNHGSTSNLFSLIHSSDDGSVFLTGDHKLSKGNEVISEEAFGQSNTSGFLQLGFPTYARTIVSSKGYLLLMNRAVKFTLKKKIQYNNGGSVVFLPESGDPLYSPRYRGYFSDIVLLDLDGDGTGEILVSQIDESFFGGGAYILRFK